MRAAFEEACSFPLDPFQAEAFDALDEGKSVLVTAPTGAGKTLVAEYAVTRALANGRKAFYTTPLKALSNQKFAELCQAHGSDRVGLLTGDTSIRPGAPVVVMTTEVLRNMLLAGSDLLQGLQAVVLDEVHYLQDPYRGGVWEEVLVLCPPDVIFVCLSATVANASELGDWLRSVRGPTQVVVSRHRPVELRHHLAVHWRNEGTTELVPLLVEGRLGGEAARLDQAARRASRDRPPPNWRRGPGSSAPRLPFRGPRRTELIEELGERQLLPAIVFIFSRAACEDAVRQCLREGIRLAANRERAIIRRIAEEHTDPLADDDLAVLGYGEWLEGLEAGVAAHHAGLVPAFRETVEEAFAAGLLKAVFATETLSLGINMPARTVAIERFTKFGGAGRAPLTSGEYAQLTGRAGRRGLDREGNAVALWSPETSATEMSRIALAPPPDLRSSFRPTYNLAVNLMRRFDRPMAVEVLRRSFAQWQAAHHGPRRETLVDLLARRLAVLEELGYVDGWSVRPLGLQLSRVYHEADLLVTGVLAGEALRGAEPAVVAGVLSSLVFERRRARKVLGAPRRRRPGRGTGDRLGEGRRADLAERLALVLHQADQVRALEEIHLVPRTRQPEPGLATAVTAWARGASFRTVLEVATIEAGEIAPGDFVRTVKQLADLVGQVAQVATDQAVAEAARVATGQLLRDVVATAPPTPVGSPTAPPARS